MGAGALAGCGGTPAETSGTTPTTTSAPGTTQPPGSTPGGSPSGSVTGGSTGQAPAGVPVKKADVPVGGGTIRPDDDIVVTQPTEGEFHAFSATCTHQQCPLAAVRDGKIECDCHGSKFGLTDGEPEGGPARAPLAKKTVTQQGDSVYVS